MPQFNALSLMQILWIPSLHSGVEECQLFKVKDTSERTHGAPTSQCMLRGEM